jgi:lipopolysaccharide transport system permease protein
MAETARDESWTLIIQPGKRMLDLDLRELYRYRDLIRLFVNRDFVTVYKQTILGPIWFILNPLFTTVVYTFIFGGLAKIPTDGVPQTLFYYAGTMLWGYFSSCLNSTADTFTGNSGLFSKVFFPRLTVPISKVFSNLIAAGIQFGTLVAFYVYYVLDGSHVHPTLWVFAIPLLFAQLAALGTGFGMVISALTTKSGQRTDRGIPRSAVRGRRTNSCNVVGKYHRYFCHSVRRNNSLSTQRTNIR